MKKIMIALLGLVVVLGCARVSVQAPKDPIKVDISMRLDIYQHIKNDIDDIENMVTGSSPKPKTQGPQSFLNIFVSQAYAAEDLSSEVQAAALRRKDRRDQLISLAEKGIIGENKSGLLVIRLSDKTDASATKLVNEENRDRMIIYQSVAQKNGSSVEEVQKLYAKRLQQDALAGTPIEVFDNARGSFEWTIKK
jgi:uncharacterized protein YdbL (DUF1318 family)